MVKMPSLLYLAAMILGTSASSSEECGIDGSKAFSDAADAAVFIWAATQRCDIEKEAAPKAAGDPCAPQVRRLSPKGCEESQRRLKDVGALKPNNAVRCAIDISSAIEAVGKFANVIVGALDKCGVLKTENKECGMAAGKLTTAAAGLAAGASGLINSCPNEFQPSPLEKIPIGLERKTDLGKCVIDAKNSLASTFDVMESLKKITSGRRRRKTEHDALNTVSAFASIGSAIAAAVNDCTAYENGGKGNGAADCSSYVLGLVARLHGIADIATTLAKDCESDASRLYIEGDESTKTVTDNSMSLALAAFLPVAAIFGFVGGRRFGKSRENREVGETFAMLQVE